MNTLSGPLIRSRAIAKVGYRLILIASALTVWDAVAAPTADAVTVAPTRSAITDESPVSASTDIQAPRAQTGLQKQNRSEAVRQLTDWIIETHDNKAMPFIIIDKVAAEVFVFYPDGRLRGAAPALLGLAIGDDSVPGIGKRKLSTIRPDERTTPAGRFVASLDRNLHGEEILWIDYEAAISLHRVITSNPKERRLQRLSAAAPLDHRISYGCINVPVKFYEQVVSPSFTKTSGVVYVLPETRSAAEVFPAYDAAQRARLRTSQIDNAGNPGVTLTK